MFYYVLIIDDCTVTNKYLVLLITILELSILQYFYINTDFTYLKNFTLFSQYFRILSSYFFHIQPFTNSMFTAVLLTFYPLVMIVVYLAKKLNNNKLLKIIVQIANYIFPLLSVKITIEFIHALTNQIYLYICLPMGLLSIAFGVLLLILNKRIHRYI